MPQSRQPRLELTKTRLQEGRWEGLLRMPSAGADTPPPSLEITHLEQTLEHALSPIEGETGAWMLSIELPVRIISDGLQVVLIRDPESGETLGSIAILAEDPLVPDLRAEVALMRAELDMLKRVLRRQGRDGD